MRATLLQLLVWLAFAMWFPAQAPTADAGQQAPAWQVTTLDGRVVRSDSLKDRVVLVHFWATWCPLCREEMPALAAFYKQHAKDSWKLSHSAWMRMATSPRCAASRNPSPSRSG